MSRDEKEELESTLTLGPALIEPTIDLGVNYAEIGLGLLLKEVAPEIFQEIPILRTLVALPKVTSNVKDVFFAKKVLAFLHSFHTGEVDPQAREEFKSKYRDEHDYRAKVNEHLLVAIDRLDSVRKAQIVSNLFLAYISGLLEWDRYLTVSACLERLNLAAVPFLDSISAEGYSFHGRDVDNEGLLMGAGIGHRHGSKFEVTDYGRDLHRFGIRGDLSPHPPRDSLNVDIEEV